MGSGTVHAVALLLRRPAPCVLGESLLRVWGEGLDIPGATAGKTPAAAAAAAAGAAAAADADTTTHQAMVFLGNHRNTSFSAAQECDKAIARASQCGCERVLAVHDRALAPVTAAAAAAAASGGPHLIRVFCDGGLLGSGAPTQFSIDMARRLTQWLGAGGTKLPSGSCVNITNLNGRAVAGVMTGGAKMPLGAMP